jgi:hypothetical protein
MPYGYEGLYITIGPPGTGKTRFLADRVERIVAQARQRSGCGRLPKGTSPVLICSLTRAAAAEIASRCQCLPDAATATLHAHAYRARPGPAVLGKKDLAQWNERYPQYKLTGVYDSRFVKETDDMPAPVDAADAGDPGRAVHDQYQRLRQELVPRADWPPGVEAFARLWEAFKRDVQRVDFTDLLELAPGEPPLGASVIIVDEAQDLSPMALRLVRRWVEAAGAGILVGDPHQALYTWAGADPSFLTEEPVPEDHRGVLSQSYRLPAEPLEYARHWLHTNAPALPEVEFRPRQDTHGAPAQGFVTHLDGSLRDLEPVLDATMPFIARGESVMLVTTTRFDANGVAKELRERGIPFANPWRASERRWNPLGGEKAREHALGVAAFFAPAGEGGRQRTWTWGEAAAWLPLMRHGEVLTCPLEDVRLEAKRSPREPIPDAVFKRLFGRDVACELADWLTAHQGEDPLAVLHGIKLVRRYAANPERLRYVLEVLRVTGRHALLEEPRLYVGTAHSFKGAEAGHVVVFPDISPKAYDASRYGGPAATDIARTFYVAFTRTSHGLYLCRPAKKRHVNLPSAVHGLGLTG